MIGISALVLTISLPVLGAPAAKSPPAASRPASSRPTTSQPNVNWAAVERQRQYYEKVRKAHENDNHVLTEQEKLRNEVLGYVHNSEFEKLDRLAGQLVKERKRYPNGDWAITEFYGCFKPLFMHEVQISNMKDWAKERADSATARLAMAHLKIQDAWRARGSGYSNTVHEPAGQTMEQDLNEAIEQLQAARKLDSKDPAWGAMYLEAGLLTGAPLKDMITVYEQAVQSEADYPLLHREMATALMPRWYGGPGDLEKFAAAAADQYGGERKDAMYAYFARVAWSFERLRFPHVHHFAWPRVRSGLQQIAQQWPDPGNLHVFAHICADVADRGALKEFLSKLPHDASGKVLFDEAARFAWGSEGHLRDWEDWAAAKIENPAGNELQLAARVGNAERVRELIQRKVPLNERMKMGSTALLLACTDQQQETALLLIEAGADVNIASIAGVTPLAAALRNGEEKVALRLLEKGASPTQAPTPDEAPIHLAVTNNFLSVLKALMARGVDPNTRDSRKMTPLINATMNSQDEVVALLLAQPGIDVNATGPAKYTALHRAAEHGDVPIIKMLLAKGADPLLQVYPKMTPLDLARKGKFEAAAKLLANAASTHPAQP